MRHLLMPHNREQAEEFLRLAIAEAERFGVTPPTSVVPAGLEQAARWVEQRRDSYIENHGSVDPGTGVTEFPGYGAEYVEELDEIAEGIRSLSAVPQQCHTGGVTLIAAERQRQVQAEGWTPAHDDAHADGLLSDAAACYALVSSISWKKRLRIAESGSVPDFWPWHSSWWKPANRKRDLVKAGALIAAELDRLLRAESAPQQGGE